MSVIKSYKDLIVWQKSIDLVTKIYKITENFPKEEIYALTNQMRRCAVSIPSNIAEGRGRGTRKDFAQFLRIASGSAAELETQLIISKEIYQKIEFKEVFSLLLEIQKMLTVIIKRTN